MRKITCILFGILFADATLHSYAQEQKQNQSQEKQKDRDVTFMYIIREHPYLTAFVIIYTIEAVLARGQRAV